MILEGVITNVTHFGAFVDVGVHQDGLVHISELDDTFVHDPSDIVDLHLAVRTNAILSVDTLLDHGVGPADAAAWPHLSQRNRGTLALELDFDAAQALALADLGHAQG